MSHEQVYVQDIVAAASAHGSVEAIAVEVGELAPLPAEELKQALAFTGWHIAVTQKPGLVRCRCGHQSRPVVTEKGHDFTIYHCAACKAPLPAIIDGKDIVLKSVTVS